MKIFGQLVRTAVNVAVLPIVVARDVVMGGAIIAGEPAATPKHLAKIKREAGEETP